MLSHVRSSLAEEGCGASRVSMVDVTSFGGRYEGRLWSVRVHVVYASPKVVLHCCEVKLGVLHKSDGV